MESPRESNTRHDRDSTPPPVQGWVYPVKPAWTHDLLELWERNKPLVQLLELASDRVAQEVLIPSSRRRTLHQISRYFVPVAGEGPRSRTTSPNPWAAYSQLFATEALAPAYLVQAVAHNDMMNAAGFLFYDRYGLGETVALRDVRNHLVSGFGDRPTARASANSILRTLVHFGILKLTTGAGMFRYSRRLPVGLEPFPLLIWAWWRIRRENVIRIPDLASDPLLTFLQHDSYAAHWAEYESSLWTLEMRDGMECAVLRNTDNAAFIRTMFNLLSSHPKWPTVQRQYPEP